SRARSNSKTVVPARVPWVRIPPPPPIVGKIPLYLNMLDDRRGSYQQTYSQIRTGFARMFANTDDRVGNSRRLESKNQRARAAGAVARQAHNLKVVGSNPTPATTFTLYTFNHINHLGPSAIGGTKCVASTGKSRVSKPRVPGFWHERNEPSHRVDK